MEKCIEGLIKCPICGREYLQQEIYLPKYFFGNPNPVMRDKYGKITNVLGDQMDLSEQYECDTCGTKMKVSQRVSFKCEQVKNKFTEEYVSKLKEDKLYFQEE